MVANSATPALTVVIRNGWPGNLLPRDKRVQFFPASRVCITNEGDYVSVSSLGNFFSTLENDSDAWIAHQRASSKRVQSIGFNPEGSLWMLSRGAEIRFNEDSNDLENWSKPIIPILNGYNYLDMGWDPNGDIWAGGGNGTLIVSKDQGKTWNRDPIASELPTNYIKIVFLDKEALDKQKGFVLGERGYILKWNS